MSFKFLADANLNRAIVTGLRLRESAIDFVHGDEAGIRGLPDPLVLEFAARENRVLVSHDVRTLPVHFLRRLRDGKQSPGVLLAKQAVPVGDVIEALLLVWSIGVPADLENQIRYLPGLSLHEFR